GSIGKQITQHLDAERVFSVLEDYVARLLDADMLFIYMLKQDELESLCRIERGQRMPCVVISLDDPDSNSVRCLQ
ncbi:hypothetical protein WKI10_18575, partial [Bordetella pertussis]|uniref:hypothetical protein n=1 Tax=Bordetella pertussis TaxID=520 RepID=UPI0030C9D4D2